MTTLQATLTKTKEARGALAESKATVAKEIEGLRRHFK